jgi:integrase/recombinase XerD
LLMPRKGSTRPWPELGQPPRGLTSRTRQHFEWLKTQHTPATLEGRYKELRRFLEWCAERELTEPEHITLPVLERYQRHLFNARKKTGGAPLSASTQCAMLNAVRQLFRWLTRNNYVLYNPAADLQMPKLPEHLPRSVLTPNEVERVLSQPDISTLLGIRDRAILEVLYSTGARRAEVLGLEVCDLNAEQGTLMIREGKGRRDRMVPLGARALRWVMKYLNDVRPTHAAKCPESRFLFVSEQGKALGGDYVTHRFRRYIRAAEVNKAGACHVLRHSMATGMLEGGADVRFIQAMLGHANLKTTQVYTRVSIQKLKAVHATTHPAENPRRSRGSAADLSLVADVVAGAIQGDGAHLAPQDEETYNGFDEPTA